MKKVFFAVLSAFILMPFFSSPTHAGDCETIDTTYAGQKVRITGGVNVRQPCQGDEQGDVIGTVSTGQVLELVGTADFELWWVVKLEDGTEGFIFKTFAELTEDSSEIDNGVNPVAPTEPTPTEETPSEPDPVPEEPVVYNPPSQADPNKKLWDVYTHEFEKEIFHLAGLGIIDGNPDGSYLPNKGMYRGEFAKLMVEALEGESPDPTVYNDCFPDFVNAEKTEHEWYEPYMCLLNEKKVILGFDDGRGGAGEVVNLAQAATMFTRYFNLATPEMTEDAEWYMPAILAMQEQALLSDTFGTANDAMTKGEFAVVLYRYITNTTGSTTDFDFSLYLVSDNEPDTPDTPDEPETPDTPDTPDEPDPETTPDEPTTGNESAICSEKVLNLVDMTGAVMVGDEDSLRSALSMGGKVQLTGNISATAPFNITEDGTLDLNGFAIDGNNSTHLLVVDQANFTVQNGTLRNANNQVSDDEHFSRRSGAALMATGFTADGQPGVGRVNVIDVIFENNKIKPTGPGDLRGGALYLFALPDATVSGSTFRNNTGSNGGAIGGLGSSIEVIDSVFENNKTNGPGGGGALEGHGGAISLDAVSQNDVTAYFDVCGSTFDGNESTNGGGSIYAVMHQDTATEVNIEKNYFTGNRATANESVAGAIYMQDDSNHAPAGKGTNTFIMKDNTFENNEAHRQAGGVWALWNNSSVTEISNNTFVGNKTNDEALGMGGALVLTAGKFGVIGNTFANNYAYFHGGGIQANEGISLDSFEKNYFENNPCARAWGFCHTNATFLVGSNNMQFMAASLIQDANSNAPVAPGTTILDAPQLQSLGDNGGAVPTMAFIDGPAKNAGVGAYPTN